MSKVEEQGYTLELLFDSFDIDKDGMLTLAEFTDGVSLLMGLSPLIVAKIFGAMDVLKIGMIDFEKFKKVLEAKGAGQLPRALEQPESGFEWQEDVVKAIKNYVKKENLQVQDAFRFFDQDFDGVISKKDMKTSLEKLVGLNPARITEPRLDRLFRLLSFYKAEFLQPSDFDRLLDDVSPYLTAVQGSLKA